MITTGIQFNKDVKFLPNQIPAVSRTEKKPENQTESEGKIK